MAEGRPVLSQGEVHAWAAKFGLCAAGEQLSFVKELPSYDDLNFHIGAPDGREYVLKAHNGMIAAGTPARLDSMNALIARLREAGVPVPAVVAAPDGRQAISMDGPDACAANKLAHVRVLTYLPGHLVPNDTPKTDAFLQAVGEFCGRMTVALEGFADEGAKWDWDWHMKNVARVCSEKLTYVSDPTRQALAKKLIASYDAALTPAVMEALPHSVIHSDLNDTNLLFEGDTVVGVIDFGDSIYSCTIFEVAVAAGYYSLGQEDPLRVFSEVLRGYLRRARLSDAELAVFYHATYGRVLLSACFSAQSCAAEPDNEYLAHTAEPGWAVLTRLQDVSPETALATFRRVQAEVAA